MELGCFSCQEVTRYYDFFSSRLIGTTKHVLVTRAYICCKLHAPRTLSEDLHAQRDAIECMDVDNVCTMYMLRCGQKSEDFRILWCVSLCCDMQRNCFPICARSQNTFHNLVHWIGE